MAYRFRRLDQYQFVIEKSRVMEATYPAGPMKGKVNPRGGETVWEVETFHSRADSMIRRAIDDGIGGNDIKELQASVETAKRDCLAALSEAIEGGHLTMNAYNAKVEEGTRKRKATLAEKETVTA